MLVWGGMVAVLLVLGGLLFVPVGNPDLPPQGLWLRAQHRLLPGLYWQRRLLAAQQRLEQAQLVLDGAKADYRQVVRGRRQQIEQARRLAQQEQRNPVTAHRAVVVASRARIHDLRKQLQGAQAQLRRQQRQLETIQLLKLQEMGLYTAVPAVESAGLKPVGAESR